MSSILSTLIVDDVFGAAMRAAIYSPNYGGDLYIVGKSYTKDADVDDVIAGRARPESVMLSSDGQGWIAGWHRDEDGAASDEVVYVERHTAARAYSTARAMHGYADKVSRRIVQVG